MDYEYQAWMTPSGDFAGRIEVNTTVPSGLVRAPAGGGWGCKWDGKSWEDDPDSDARVEAFMRPPEQRLAEERASMVCSRVQAMLACGEERWTLVSTVLASQPWEVRARFEDATEWHRLNPLVDVLARQVLGLSETQLDDLFRYAVTL